jgi:competence protein ComEC
MQQLQNRIKNIAPFLRLIFPLITGIICNYYFRPDITLIGITGILAIILWLLFELIPLHLKYKYYWIQGMAINLIFICLGSGTCFLHTIQNHSSWIGNNLKTKTAFRVTILEEPVEKNNSFKALARAEFANIHDQWEPAEGNILLYFTKNEPKPILNYGSQLIINPVLQDIPSAGNPGSFNYREYLLFQNTGYQSFLTRDHYTILKGQNQSVFYSRIFMIRKAILQILEKFISGNNEKGIAEALLIGYRENLDRELIQSYSNTGVIHIIAISGLHLAMIYGIIIFIFSAFSPGKWISIVKAMVIICILWTFSLVAGNAPSVQRSAIMFTFLVLGEILSKKNNIYNNLAASAFLILLFHPFSLWDAGFQLSYAAVLSIAFFSKPIHNWLHFNNKIVKGIWNLLAVSLAAQILTFPLVVYHFHRFPVFFLFSNLFAIPISGLILYTELFLVAFSPLESIGRFTGQIAEKLITLLNHIINRADNLPFGLINNISLSIPESLFLYAMIAGIGIWWLQKQRSGVIFALIAFMLFTVFAAMDRVKHNLQQKIIIYNIPKYQAIDVIEGRKNLFIGDAAVLENSFLNNFHLQPSRILYQITQTNQLLNYSYQPPVLSNGKRKIIIIDNVIPDLQFQTKIKADVLIISKNPEIEMSELVRAFDCNQYVFDATNPLWKIRNWKKACDSLHLRHYSVPEQGAFEMEL